MFKKLKDKWAENKLTREFEKNANKYFSNEERQILTSPWGLSRLEQRTREHNKERKHDPFHQVYIKSFEDAVQCMESYDNYQKDEFSSMVASPRRSRNLMEKAILSSVLHEGKDKTPEELARPTLREVSSQDQDLINNEKWQKTQEKIAAYNAQQTDPESKIEISDLDELASYLHIHEMSENHKLDTAYSAVLQKAHVLSGIVKEIEQDNKKYTGPYLVKP